MSINIMNGADVRQNQRKSLHSRTERPDSQCYTEFEDDDSDVEQDSLRSSNRSYDGRRHSDTTVSSYDVATPQSDKDQQRPFEILIKPVAGPNGPHLFRSSTCSAEFEFDSILQLSPIEEKSVRPQPSPVQSVIYPERRQSSLQTPIPAYIPGLPENVHDWSTQDVVDWMYSMRVEMPIIERFENNDINGTVLVEMQFDDLKELDIQSFGKRHSLWAVINTLKTGADLPSPVSTPFQDLTSPITLERRDSGLDTPIAGRHKSSSRDGRKKRKCKHRKDPKSKRNVETVSTPTEMRDSIVAIEERYEEPLDCDLKEKCPEWRRQQRKLAHLKDGADWKLIPRQGGGYMRIIGDPGNPATAPNLLHLLNEQEAEKAERYSAELRPMSDVPSMVPSSALFGPGGLPEFGLHEDQLNQVKKVDPQESVKQFLSLQHVNISPEQPATPPMDVFPDDHFEMFPNHYYQKGMPSPVRPATRQSDRKSLPRLHIPRAATADPSMTTRRFGPSSAVTPTQARDDYCKTPTTAYRVGSPVSEMDIPITMPNLGPIARDASQSVPPNMLYRDLPSQPSIIHSTQRLASFALPSLREEELSPRTTPQPSTSLAKSQVAYGLDCTHAGFMKKRKNKLLRHEWQDSHVRLHGTSLAMHADSRAASTPVEKIDVNNYAVACASNAGNGKISAALKKLQLRSNSEPDGTAFSFQLIPELGESARAANGKLQRSASVKGKGDKTHHFAVGDREERIDWMRELMLAKAKGKKADGFEVRVNGRGA